MQRRLMPILAAAATLAVAASGLAQQQSTKSEDGQAVMVLTTDAPVAQGTVDRILELDGFAEGRAVSL